MMRLDVINMKFRIVRVLMRLERREIMYFRHGIKI
jgi:hypothetical protein